MDEQIIKTLNFYLQISGLATLSNQPTKSEIKKAKKQLAKQYHPEQLSKDPAVQIFDDKENMFNEITRLLGDLFDECLEKNLSDYRPEKKLSLDYYAYFFIKIKINREVKNKTELIGNLLEQVDGKSWNIFVLFYSIYYHSKKCKEINSEDFLAKLLICYINKHSISIVKLIKILKKNKFQNIEIYKIILHIARTWREYGINKPLNVKSLEEMIKTIQLDPDALSLLLQYTYFINDDQIINFVKTIELIKNNTGISNKNLQLAYQGVNIEAIIITICQLNGFGAKVLEYAVSKLKLERQDLYKLIEGARLSEDQIYKYLEDTSILTGRITTERVSGVNEKVKETLRGKEIILLSQKVESILTSKKDPNERQSKYSDLLDGIRDDDVYVAICAKYDETFYPSQGFTGMTAEDTVPPGGTPGR